MKKISFYNFDLRFSKKKKSYLCQLDTSSHGEAPPLEFKFPFQSTQLADFLNKVEDPISFDSLDIVEIKQFGGLLFETVFSQMIGAKYISCKDEVEKTEGLELRIRLHLNNTPELAFIPWEFLYQASTEEFLCMSQKTSLVRYLDILKIVEPPRIKPPIRILAIISSPTDLPLLNVKVEKEKIQKALYNLIQEKFVDIKFIENATLEELKNNLWIQYPDYHILHYIGHGDFDINGNNGVLYLENERKKSYPIKAEEIGMILTEHETLKLVILNCCRGAKTHSLNPFAGTASQLIQKGIPAVVAMQFVVTDSMAIEFAKEFYACVATGLPIDLAIRRSRKAIFSSGNKIEWGTPVLFLRSPDGVIFDIERRDDSQVVYESIPGLKQKFHKKGNLGRIAHLMCNRDQQVRDFSKFFQRNIKENPNLPQFYIIHGNKYDCHKSLIERLIEEKVKIYFEKTLNDTEAVIETLRMVPWPDNKYFESSKTELKYKLFQKCAADYIEEDDSVKAFSRLPCFQKKKAVVICHDISTKTWDMNDYNLMVWYIKEFWSLLDCSSDIPLFIIFFNIIDSEDYKRIKIQKLFRKSIYSKEYIMEELKQIFLTSDKNYPYMVISELNPISIKHVREWLNDLIEELDIIKEQIIDSIFREKDKLIEFRSMAYIELALQKIIQERIVCIQKEILS